MKEFYSTHYIRLILSL